MRLDKLIANSGFGTRSEVKKLIKRGLVSVNGRPATSGNAHVDHEQDAIVVNGIPLEYREFVYLMMNKPPGYISATEDNSQATVLDLIDPSYVHFKLFPMGRLDKDTEGLLILTNDGKLAHQVLSPKKHVEKTYYVEVEGRLTDEDVIRFQEGLDLGDFMTMPAQLAIVDSGRESTAVVVIKEGKFHQVKRMFEAVGKEVVYLKRIQMGQLALDESLALGEYRELEADELELLIASE